MKEREIVTINDLQEKIWKFGEERPVWQEGQTARQLAVGIVEESVELLHCFRFSNEGEGNIDEELADIFIVALTFAQVTGINVIDVVLEKLKKMENEFPKEYFQEGRFKERYLQTKNERNRNNLLTS